jgi:formate dehydrogenase subunit gamma
MAEPLRTELPSTAAERAPTVAGSEGVSTAPKSPRGPRVLRFRKTERLVHWSLAIPFLVCYTTAVILIVLQTRAPHNPLRPILSWAHRLSGVCLICFPLIAVFRSKGDLRIHFYNIRQAWIWTLSDIRWLLLAGAAAVSKHVSLPEQGKFNAAEKLNFMMLMTMYPLYILTGLTIWLTHNAFISWILHVGMALIGSPLVLGHIYMAAVNPSSRTGLQGMISGFVDRHWAKHHYRQWFHENFKSTATIHAVASDDAHPARSEVHILCSCCGQSFVESVETLARAIPEAAPLFCKHCGAEIHRLSVIPDPSDLESTLSGAVRGGDAVQLLVQAVLEFEQKHEAPRNSDCYVAFSEGTEGPGLYGVLKEHAGPEAIRESA